MRNEPMPHFTLREAADHLGVHYMTMYRYVRLGLIPAVKTAGSWRVTAVDLESFARPQAGRPVAGESPWAERLAGRMLAGDVAGSWSVVESAMASGAAPEQVYSTILAPALTLIGDKWADGAVGVEDEHLATAVATRLIGRMGARFTRRGRSKGLVVAVTPPGERHALGMAMVADVLRGRGFEVLELGPDLPVAGLLRVIERLQGLHAVCVSVIDDTHLPACAAVVTAVKASLPEVIVLVGGRAVTGPAQAAALGADGFALEAVGAADLVVELAGCPPPSW